jgi:hypothetical protein
VIAGGAQERTDLPTRPGVTQPVYITAVPAPSASVILFPGGSGIFAQVRNNFLLRRPPLCRGLMTVAVIDTPSDCGAIRCKPSEVTHSRGSTTKATWHPDWRTANRFGRLDARPLL